MRNRFDERDRELIVFLKKLGIVLCALLLLTLFWAVRHVLLLIFIAAVVAAGIAPAVRRVRVLFRHYTGRRLRRGPAVLLVYFPFLILISVVALVTLPRLLSESRDLMAQLPPLIDQKILQPLSPYIDVKEVHTAIFKGGRERLAHTPILVYVRTAAGFVGSVVAVLFMIVYMLIDGARLRNLFLLFYPAEERSAKRAMVNRIGRRMSSWLSAQLLLAGIVGAATLVTLLCLRVPYALPLAVLASIGEMVPVIGPILGAIPSLAVALFQSRWQFWSVLAMAIIIQKAENLFLVPRLMGRKVSVSPLSVFIAFMIGGSLLGVMGAVLAIPVTVIVQVVFEEAFLRQRERRQDLNRPGTVVKRADG